MRQNASISLIVWRSSNSNRTSISRRQERRSRHCSSVSDIFAWNQKRHAPSSSILTDIVENVRRKHTTTIRSRHHHQPVTVLSRRRGGRDYGHRKKGHSSFGEEHDCRLVTGEVANKKQLINLRRPTVRQGEEKEGFLIYWTYWLRVQQ